MQNIVSWEAESYHHVLTDVELATGPKVWYATTMIPRLGCRIWFGVTVHAVNIPQHGWTDDI